MSDKLYVRDILERLRGLDGTLPTNIEEIRLGSFQDNTRVHLLNEEQLFEEMEEEQVKSLGTQRKKLSAEVEKLRREAAELRDQMLKEKEAVEKRLAGIRETIRRIKLNRLKPAPKLP